MLPAVSHSAQQEIWLSVGCFGLLFVASFFLLGRLGFVNAKQRRVVCSTIGAFVHGLLAVCLSGRELLVEPYVLDQPNTRTQLLVMHISTGYFVVDFCGLVADWKDWKLFLAHHVACVLYMLTAEKYGVGAQSVMALMFWGEITNPCQNMWFLSSLTWQALGSPAASRIFDHIEPVHVAWFAIVRCTLAPLVAFHLTWYFLFSGLATHELPLHVRVFWSVLALGVPLGSWGFAWENLTHALLTRIGLSANSRLPVLSLLVFACTTTLDWYNEWLFAPREDGGAGFAFPVLATTLCIFGMFCFSLLATCAPKLLPVSRFRWDMMPSLAVVALCFSTSAAACAAAVHVASLRELRLLQTALPVLVVPLVWLTTRKVQGAKEVAAALVLMCGASLATVPDRTVKTSELLVCMLAATCCALNLVAITMATGLPAKLHVLDIVMFATLPACVMLVPVGIAVGEVEHMARFVSEHGWGHVIGHAVLGSILLLLCTSVVIACVKNLSALFVSACFAFSGAMIGVVDIMTRATAVQPAHVTGIVVSLGAFSYLCFVQLLATGTWDSPKLTAGAREEEEGDDEEVNREGERCGLLEGYGDNEQQAFGDAEEEDGMGW